MSYFLFLDDERSPDDVVWVTFPCIRPVCISRSYEEFVHTVAGSGVPAFVSYDMDLCAEHYMAYVSLGAEYVIRHSEFKTKCGIHCVRHMLQVCRNQGIKHPEYIIHSLNEHARPFAHYLIRKHNEHY